VRFLVDDARSSYEQVRSWPRCPCSSTRSMKPMQRWWNTSRNLRAKSYGILARRGGRRHVAGVCRRPCPRLACAKPLGASPSQGPVKS
jgi:hypothetical protein